MKTKYIAGVALLAWLGVAGWLASMVIAKPAVLRLGNQAEETAEMAQLRSRIARNREVMESVAVLRGGTATFIASGPLLALPAAAPAAVSTGAAADPRSSYAYGGAAAPVQDGRTHHAVSMVLVASGRRLAVVNGRQVTTGSRLDGGARVAAIGPDWVRIVGSDGAPQTYHVPNPLQPDPAGGHR